MNARRFGKLGRGSYPPIYAVAAMDELRGLEISRMNSDVANKAATVCLLSLLAGCVSSGNRDVSHAVKALEGQPRQQALNAFGRPSLTTIKNGQSISYWPMAEVEQYLGPSNLRIVDGQTVVSETQGVKLKERRLNCVVKVTANAASRSSTARLPATLVAVQRSSKS